MRSIMICLLAVLISSSVSFAQKVSSASINLEDYQHPQQYFLDHYGTDDSTRALINYFFRIRRAAAVETIVGSVFTSGVISEILTTNVTFFIVAFAPVIFAGALLIIDGPASRLIYTRKKLLHLIADYQSGKHLPKRIVRKWRFKRELRNIHPN